MKILRIFESRATRKARERIDALEKTVAEAKGAERWAEDTLRETILKTHEDTLTRLRRRLEEIPIDSSMAAIGRDVGGRK